MKLIGIIAVSDSFDRIRLLLNSTSTITFLKSDTSNFKKPYIFFPYPQDEIYGECIFILPKLHRSYWLEKAKEYRGKNVNIEYKIRKYNYGTKKGISFDIINIELINQLN